MRFHAAATLLLLSAGSPPGLVAQSPRPAAAPNVWVSTPPAWRAPARTAAEPNRGTGCGQGCSLGATIGILAGGAMGFYAAALSSSRTAWPVLIGAVLGGLTGAMIGSGSDDDAPADSTSAAGG